METAFEDSTPKVADYNDVSVNYDEVFVDNFVKSSDSKTKKAIKEILQERIDTGGIEESDYLAILLAERLKLDVRVKPVHTAVNFRLPGDGQPEGLMIIIDYPTTKEDKIHTICYGTPRRVIDAAVRKYFKGHIYWTSAVKVGIDNTKLQKKQVWKPYVTDLIHEIELVKPKKILCLGATALSAVLGVKGLAITHNHGRAYRMKFKYGECYLLSTYNPYQLMKDDGYSRDILRDIKKLFTHDTVYPEPYKGFSSPKDVKELTLCLNKLNSYKAISLDIETSSLNYRTGKIESIGFGASDGYNVIVNHHILYTDWCFNLLRRFLTTGKPTFVFHNGKFDIKWLEHHLNFKLGVNIADTMLMNYMLDERPIGKYAVHSLKDLSRIYFDASDYHFNFNKWNKTSEDERDYNKYWQYQCLDLQYTIRLYHELMEQFKGEARCLKTYETLIVPTLKMFVQAEETGFLVDTKYLDARAKELKVRIDELQGTIKRLVSKDFNALSPTQLHVWLLNELGIVASARRETNQGSTNMGTGKDEIKQYILQVQAQIDEESATSLPDTCLIERKKEYIEILEHIMQLRQLSKLNSTYFEGLFHHADKNDERVRTDIRIAGTATGRLSASEPNLQNIPSRVKLDGKDVNELVKNAFIVPEGYSLIEVDYAQLELRMASYLSRDEVMASLFRNGTDMHKVVASKMFHKEVKEVTKNERYLAKAIGFGILYGRGAKALVDGVEMDFYVEEGGTRASEKEMQQFIDDFLNQFPTLKEWIANMHDNVMKNQAITTIFGRKRRFPIILPDVYKQNEIKRQAVNTLIQSAASDLCLSAAIGIDKYLQAKYSGKANLLLTVHDSIMVQAKDEVVAEIVKAMSHIMSKGVINDSFIPFSVEAKVGKKWGETKEYVEEELAVAV